jgi:Cu-processing system permease protein
VIAWKEFQESIRNQWFIGIIIVFTVLALVIAGYGTARKGDAGAGFAVTIASLVGLVIYLMPIMALLLGSGVISGEREHGSLALLLVQPVTRLEIIAGKYLGLALALVIATLLGFGFTGVLLLLRTGMGGFGDYLVFLVSTACLGLVFLSIALFLSVITRGKAGATIGAVAVWFGAVFIFDLVLLGILVMAAGKDNFSWLTNLLLFNPVDLFRLINVAQIESLQSSMGLTGLIPAGFTNNVLVAGLFLSWIFIPLGIAGFLFSRQEI